LSSKFKKKKKNKVILKSLEEIELMRQSALMVSKTLGLIAEHIRPGVTTLDLDQMAEQYIRDHGGDPGFKGMYDFPNTLCMSRNEAVVHGIPNKKELQEGDIISVDCGVIMNDFFGDHAYTFGVGEVKPEVQKLLDVTKECLYLGLAQAKSNNRIGDISFAVQQHAEKHGYSVVRELVGHGLGRDLHEKPEVPNFGKRGQGPRIMEGMVLAIEPMINMGTRRVVMDRDNTTFLTADKKPSAHYEHDVAVVNGQPEILSTFDYVEDALGIERTTPRPSVEAV
jgi:methionyl aminopeptidase